MKITAIQDYLRTGGTEAQFLDLTQRWAEDGHTVKRIVFRRGGELATKAASGPIPLYLQPFETPFNWWAPGLAGALREQAPDKVIGFGRNAHGALARALKPGPLPGLVATLRGGRTIPGGYERVLAEAEKVVVNSGYARDRALALGLPDRKIAIIENGCRLADVSLPARDRSRSQLGVSDESLVLLCMGSFVPGKAQGRLLDVWEALTPELRRKSRLWFVGDGPCRHRLQRRVAAGPDRDRIRFWGSRSDPEHFFAAADVTVSVSREESSPNALVESLWFGVPVLATACAGIADLVEEGRDGYVFPDTEDGLRSLRRQWERSAEEGGLPLNGGSGPGETARSRFDPTARAREYLDVFEEMENFRFPNEPVSR